VSASTVHVLIVFHHADGKLVQSDEFYDVKKATLAYAEKERELLSSDKPEDYEIVLIGSDSIETIMRTHGHYFAADSDFFPMKLGSISSTV